MSKKTINFTKIHGLGNDFVVIDGFKYDIENPSAFARIICDRHFGIGADGVCLVLPSEFANIKMRIINSDGSEAEMCGNGIRGIAKFAYENGLVKSKNIAIETLAGVKDVSVLDDMSVRVDMGEPVIGKKMSVNGKTGLQVSMGNPHFVIVSKNIDKLDLEKIGPKFENAKAFAPARTNTEFVKIVDKKNIDMRVWERGAGETLACGTGACATAVACNSMKLTDRHVNVYLRGGKLDIDWAKNNHIYMTGPATSVFQGSYIWSQNQI